MAAHKFDVMSPRVWKGWKM